MWESSRARDCTAPIGTAIRHFAHAVAPLRPRVARSYRERCPCSAHIGRNARVFSRRAPQLRTLPAFRLIMPAAVCNSYGDFCAAGRRRMTIDPLKDFPGYALRRASIAVMVELARRIADLGLRPTEA